MATIHINRGGTNLGTFSEEEVRTGLRAGRFLGTDLAWREGMPAWQPLSQFAEFAADLAAAATAAASGPPTPEAAPAVPPGAITPSPAPQPAVAVVPRSGLPWDRRAELGILKAFVETLQMVLMRPVDAFTAMRREGGLGDPLVYALIGGIFGTVVNLVYRFALQTVSGGSWGGDSRSHFFGSAALLGFIICSPLLVILVLFITAGLIHLCLLMVGGARQSFETTFRVICFTSGSVNPLQIVPFCGGLIAGVWGLVLYCIGLARAHETETGRAVLAVFLPIVVCCGGGLLLIILAGGLTALTHSWH